jgi:hypothetical protein
MIDIITEITENGINLSLGMRVASFN